uniref:Secreted protein n=1 Tax=Macrostomum lignano TaxID=282301 RepID=A0A1I8FFH9_9PLAT
MHIGWGRADSSNSADGSDGGCCSSASSSVCFLEQSPADKVASKRQQCHIFSATTRSNSKLLLQHSTGPSPFAIQTGPIGLNQDDGFCHSCGAILALLLFILPTSALAGTAAGTGAVAGTACGRPLVNERGDSAHCGMTRRYATLVVAAQPAGDRQLHRCPARVLEGD